MPETIVNIRFFGDKFWKGIAKRRHIEVGGHKLWSYLKFTGAQEADGSYNFPMEFYQAHRAVFDDPQKFIVKVVSDEGEVLNQEPVTENEVPEISPDLALKGVILFDGFYLCPFCIDYKAAEESQMRVHLLSHEAE